MGREGLSSNNEEIKLPRGIVLRNGWFRGGGWLSQGGDKTLILGSGLPGYEMVFGEEGCFEKKTMLSRKDVLERT